MPSYKITMPSGRSYKVNAPEGTPRETLIAKVKDKELVRESEGQTLQVWNPFSDKNFDTGIPLPAEASLALAGAGKAFTDIGRGAEDIVRDLVPGESEGSRALHQEIAESRKLDQPLLENKYGLAGNIAGNVAALAPAAFVPGANTLAGSSALGALSGALAPTSADESAESRIASAGYGLLGGAGGYGASRVASGLIAPRVSQGVRQLRDAGVRMSPGQILGGAAKRVEDAATAIPIVGDAIKAVQRTSLQDFNRAALNQALRPIGRTVTEGGREGLEQAMGIVDDAYGDVLAGIRIRPDRALLKSLNDIEYFSTASPNKAVRNEVASALRSVRERMPPQVMLPNLPGSSTAGGMSGRLFKDADTAVGSQIRTIQKSTMTAPDKYAAIGQLRRLQNALRSTVENHNPVLAPQLRELNRARAQLESVKNATSKIGAEYGEFTPAQLRSAVRGTDPTRDKRQYGMGRMLMQDLAEAGQDVLPSKVPSSGSIERLLTGVGLLGGGLAIDPTIAGTMAGMAGMYSRPGAAVMRGLLNRPQMLDPLGNAIRSTGPFAGLLGSNLMRQE